MKKTKFKKLINDLPSIEVALDWCHTEGKGKFEEEVRCENLIMFVYFECYQTAIIDKGDIFTAPEVTLNELDVYDVDFDIVNKQGDNIKLSKFQTEKLKNVIKLSIISN